MDFKALMSAQIAKSKPSTSVKATEPTSKYQRRSEQEAKRIADYEAEQQAIVREREQRAEKKRKLEEEEAEANLVREEKKRRLAEESKQRREQEDAEQERLRRKRLGLPEVASERDGAPKETTPLTDDLPDIPDEELRTKLRELEHPAVLYDETHTRRLKRYYKLIGKYSVKPRPKYTNGPIPTTLEPVEEQDMLLPGEITPSKIPSKTSEEYHLLHRQLSSYLTLLLTEWSLALRSRPESVKTSADGIRAQQTYQTVLQDLTPLFRRLEHHDLPNDLLSPIIEISHHAQNRRYVTANDTYLRLSIGKAAWPIGVTMVGIHERSAREKLHNRDSGDGADGSKQAHIMADEQTRKMLQSLKRCLSFAQTRWTPDDVGQLMG